MLRLPTGKRKELIRRVLKKNKWTKIRLSQELHVTPETISRWLAGKGMSETMERELLALGAVAPLPKTEIRGIPFTMKITRESLKVAIDENGDLVVSGLVTI